MLSTSIAFDEDVLCFFSAIFTNIKTKYMLEDWLAKRAVLRSKMLIYKKLARL